MKDFDSQVAEIETQRGELLKEKVTLPAQLAALEAQRLDALREHPAVPGARWNDFDEYGIHNERQLIAAREKTT